jgi:16S rRNA (adenine1518-N6/adenine1519-N6)-dimethyltransferase
MSYLGQNFLKNKNKIKEIVSHLEINDNDFILEIGPGHGELTKEILKELKNKNFFVLGIEKDRRLALNLLKEIKNKNFQIICGDILKILPKIKNFLPENSNFKIIGNIPYYLTGKLLRILSELKTKPIFSIFTMQKEVGERIISGPPNNNKLAAILNFWSEPEIITYISKNDFYPKPKVDSIVLKLITKNEKPQVSGDLYYKTTNILFKQPRKTILNNVLLEFKIKNQKEKEKLFKKIRDLGINPMLRPQNINQEEIIKLSGLLIDPQK